MSVVVLGATGTTGRRVVRLLRERGVEVRAASRSSPTRFDWTDESTWGPTLRGASAAYVVDSQRSDSAESLERLVERAALVGVDHLVLLGSRDAAFSGGPDWLGSERAVHRARSWTVLRPTWFMQNFDGPGLVGDGVLSGEVVGTSGEGREPFVDVDDVAAVAVEALLEPARHEGRTYELSGPEALTFADAAAHVAAASGRPVRFTSLADDDFARHCRDLGLGVDLAAALGLLGRWVRDGRNDVLSDGVEQVLGRPPTSFADYARRTASTGCWDVTRRR